MRSSNDNIKSLQLVGNFLNFCSYSNRSSHTVASYKNDLMRFLSWYNASFNKNLSWCNSHVIAEYRQFLQTGGQIFYPKLNWWKKCLITLGLTKVNTYKLDFAPLSVASTKRSLCTLKNFYDFLIESHGSLYNKFKINPIKVKLHQITLKDEDINHTKLLDTESYKLLRDKLIRPKDLLIILLLYKGGLRIAELCQLKLESFQPEGVIEIIRKRGKRQRLKIDDFTEIKYYLEKYLAQNPQINHFLFVGKDKKRSMTTRGMSLYLSRLMNKVNMTQKGISPHSYRKACATNLYLKTRDLLLVRNYLGHSDAKVTQTYIEY